MTWITVTAVPNEEHLDVPRAKFLLDTNSVVAFAAKPGELVGVWTSWSESDPMLSIAESLEDIAALIRAEEGIAEERRAEILFRHRLPVTAELEPYPWSGGGKR